MTILVAPQEKDFLSSQVEQFRQSFLNSEIQPVAQAIQYGGAAPTSITEFTKRIASLIKALSGAERSGEKFILDEDLAPIIKLAIFAQRRARAASVEQRRTKTINPEIVAVLNAELRPYDEILAKDWLESVSPAKMPRLADYLTLEEVEKYLEMANVRLSPRQFDEKFHTLQAPTLLPPILLTTGKSAPRAAMPSRLLISTSMTLRLSTRNTDTP
jgi:hypothetical protein